MRVPCMFAAAALAACGADEQYGADYGPDAGVGGASDAGVFACLASNECPAGYVCSDFGVCVRPSPTGDGGVPEPAEVEHELGEPISSQRYVYVAMTEQDQLARIDGATLAVKSIGVGQSPKVVGTIPGSDGAVVLDSINGTATIVRPTGATDAIRVLPTLQRLNHLDLDPSGRYAVVWFDLAKAILQGGLGGIGSFQDVTVIALAPGAEKAVNLTVGFRPRNVQFDAAGNRAYVVTQDGVSVIDLGYATDHEPTIIPPIPVAAATIPATDLEVAIVATGDYAVVRQINSATLRVVDLVDDPGRAWVLPLTSPATDLDLAPDGSRAYVVQRAAKLLSIVDIPGDLDDPDGVVTIDLSSATVGSLVLSRDGRRGLLYTNATLDERITLLKLDQPGYPHVTWTLKKAVRAVGIAPTGDSALLLHAKAFGDPATAKDFDEYVDRSYGYSLLDLASGFAKLQITPVDPGPFAYAPDGKKVYVALDGGNAPSAVRALQIAATKTGVVTTKPLGSPPAAVGILPGAAQAFASQRHPLGRVTFVDLATDAVRTVTGFDLNSQIVQ